MRFSVAILIITLSYTSNSISDVLLLVHGYQGNAESWERSGINKILEVNNWKRGGVFQGTPDGPKLLIHKNNISKNKVYVAELPSESPVMMQANLLSRMIEIIRTQHSSEKIRIVGHSAGGVVARMSLITGSSKNVSTLITIASPHIGTTRAEQALDITGNHGPFNVVKNMFGGSGYNALQRSKGLLFDLTRPRPGNMLYWLNAQQHPDIEYVSVVRLNPVGFAGDDMVPGFSQNMNNVPALKGRSAVYISSQAHALSPRDGETLVEILASLDR